MLVSDQGVAGAGLLKLVEKAFQPDAAEQIVAVYDQTPPDSSDKVVNELARLFRANSCDVFLAVGGGSVIDTAKGANIVVAAGSEDLNKLQGIDNIDFDLKPTIVVPTTSGTGSEVTRVAVIKNVDRHVKMLFGADKLLPETAILDPRMTATVPPRITAATGMDALTHAMEACIDLQKNPIDDAYAKAAIELIAKYLVRAVEDGSDLEARLAMANASTFAGVAFSNAMVGVVHSTAHATGAICGVPHGVANAILLPWGLEFNLPKVAGYIGELAPALGGGPAINPEPAEQARVTIQLVRDLLERLNKACGLPIRLRDAGVTEDKLPEIARTAINDGCLMYNPDDVTYAEALEILKKAF
ncbi:MAG: NAD-dependent methanol dehydrogenase [Deltaproteobacteria bacterium ADurb.Bin510]|nr:MAG: NAD-dependent methanol dehydrogenase [Deltaproteobacteria bacterium ADurb.Bin510]